MTSLKKKEKGRKANSDPLPSSIEKSEKLSEVHQIYEKVQLLQLPESEETRRELDALSNAWKDDGIPALQRQVVDKQLENLEAGIVDPVFASLSDLLNSLPMEEFSLLDAACASGYYNEVIQSETVKKIAYRGSDYSEAMIDKARSLYPGLRFDVEDLTQLTYGDKEFDVIMLSGVLEHIPAFENAISEACRVASYVILHRCPITNAASNEYTSGSQYNIKTPRTYYSRKNLVEEFQKRHFSLHREIELDDEPPPGIITSIKRMILHATGKASARKSVTFLFKGD